MQLNLTAKCLCIFILHAIQILVKRILELLYHLRCSFAFFLEEYVLNTGTYVVLLHRTLICVVYSFLLCQFILTLIPIIQVGI